MAIPRVFISSTCYDLKHIRESLKYFVKTIGYEPVLSDDGDVYYNPSDHTHDSCLKEVETCQLFILIIGGRSGGTFLDTDDSITNIEYREAITHNLPVFALVESAVYSDHHVYTINKKKNPESHTSIVYPSIEKDEDKSKIFGFIDEVRKHSVNNAVFPFNNFLDVETYLRKQWAGMMFDFLLQRSNNESQAVTNKLLDGLNLATRKSEELIKVLLKASDEDAESKISVIDNRVEAERFVTLIQSIFKIKMLDMQLDKMLEVPLEDKWYEYLDKCDDFYLENTKDYYGTDLLILWKVGGSGVQVEDYKHENPKNKGSVDELQNAYDAFKAEGLPEREKILSKIALPF